MYTNCTEYIEYVLRATMQMLTPLCVGLCRVTIAVLLLELSMFSGERTHITAYSDFEMNNDIYNPAKRKVRIFILFLNAETVSPIIIYRQKSEVFAKCMLIAKMVLYLYWTGKHSPLRNQDGGGGIQTVFAF